MKKQILFLFLLLFGLTSYSQTIYIQGTDWVGNTYVVSYPINTNLNNFNAVYDRAGYDAYYIPPNQNINQNRNINYSKSKVYIKKNTKSKNVHTFDPSNFQFKPDYNNLYNPFYKD